MARRRPRWRPLPAAEAWDDDPGGAGEGEEEAGGEGKADGNGGDDDSTVVFQLRAKHPGQTLPPDPFRIEQAIRDTLNKRQQQQQQQQQQRVVLPVAYPEDGGRSYMLTTSRAQAKLLMDGLTEIPPSPLPAKATTTATPATPATPATATNRPSPPCPAEVVEHPTKNTVRCVVRCRELNATPTEDLLEGLKPQGVTAVHRYIRPTPNGHAEGQQQQYTGTMVLTLRGTRQPTHVRFGMLRVPARPYEMRPMQCGWCWRFGHKKATCPEAGQLPVCRNCGERHTENNEPSSAEGTSNPQQQQRQQQQPTPCQKPAHCARCGLDHPADSDRCRVYRREAEVARYRSTMPGGGSFEAAKQQLQTGLEFCEFNRLLHRGTFSLVMLFRYGIRQSCV